MKYKTFENGGSVEGSVSINGLVMTGPLKLLKIPVAPNEVVNKQYVDDVASNIDAANISSGIIPVDRMPAFTGDFNSVAGSGIITLKNSGVVPGTYTKVTVNSGGLITAGSSLLAADIPAFGWEKITSGKPTTLDGYGITNAVNRNNGTVNGNITLAGDPVNGSDAVTKRYVASVLANRTGFVPGDIISNGKSTLPAGFLRCNGGEISKTTYAALYAVVGDQFTPNQQPGAGQPWRLQYDFNDTQSGNLGTWATGVNMPTALAHCASFITKDRVYICGGYNGTDSISTVYTAPITNGVIGAWTTAGNMPAALYAAIAIMTENRVYVIGGRLGDNALRSCYTAPINADGTIGSWTSGPLMIYGIWGFAAITTKNRIYVIGGYNGTAAINTIQTAAIDGSGVIGAWTTAGTLPAVWTSGAYVVTKNRIYLIGGGLDALDAISLIRTAPINTDGTLGAWSSAGNLPAAVSAPYFFASKNTVYICGGWSGSGSGSVATVYYAPINADGTLGAWVTGTALPAAVWSSMGVVTSTKAYLLSCWLSISGPIATTYMVNFAGGSSDYKMYYDGSIGVVPSTNFRLPDYTTVADPVGEYIIKAL